MLYDWRARAEEILAAGGYVRRNAWEVMLRRNLRRCRWPLYLELQAASEYEAYVVVRTAGAFAQMALMIDQGMAPDDASTLALHDLLEPGADEQNKPESWEMEAAMDSSAAAVVRYLVSLPQDQR